jgi:hypothetical protein
MEQQENRVWEIVSDIKGHIGQVKQVLSTAWEIGGEEVRLARLRGLLAEAETECTGLLKAIPKTIETQTEKPNNIKAFCPECRYSGIYPMADQEPTNRGIRTLVIPTTCPSCQKRHVLTVTKKKDLREICRFWAIRKGWEGHSSELSLAEFVRWRELYGEWKRIEAVFVDPHFQIERQTYQNRYEAQMHFVRKALVETGVWDFALHGELAVLYKQFPVVKQYAESFAYSVVR